MITVRNLTKKSKEGQDILSKISFQAGDGEFIAIVGASGSGKTMLLRCLAKQEKWDQGQYIYNNQDITSLNIFEAYRLKREWGFLNENPDVDPNKDALKNVLDSRYQHMNWFRKLTRTVSQDEHVFAMDYLEKVGLLDKGRDKVAKLSGGEKQRVAIAKALIKGAKVIFADEPMKGLHPDAQARVMEDLRSVSTRDNGTVFCSLSNLDLAERYASRIWGLNGGRIVLDINGRRLTPRERDMVFS
ncbi:phosphonate ABC transporter ATP-binding protein [Gorillibacterium sp. sgz5001074]|uniref:phosphonate ABC transporter ATP-binding protein n=1 Tax=Gorillibacterium sp. sgz5001074 TaxID=3446695 RepID=UPI003F672186